MTHVLIVEDEASLRRDLADFLELSGYRMSGVSTAAALRQVIAEDPLPDVVVLDVGLPDGNGFDLARELRETGNCGIIMLTALGESDDRIRGYESGADLYLVKHSTLREIEAAIRSLLRRTREVGDANGTTSDPWVLDGTGWTLTAPNLRVVKLTATEFAFLNLLCSRAGETCTRQELVDALTRPNWPFDNRHLDGVVSRLRRKIEEGVALPAPIKVVYGVGYTFTAAFNSA